MSRGRTLTRVAALGLTALVVAACATAGGPPEASRAAPPPSSPPPGPAPAPPPAPTPRETLAAPHRAQAAALERDGDLRGAVDELKIALTINPDDVAARDARKALEAKVEGLVAERIQAGRAALGRGVQLEARRQFLAALALDPSNRTAFQALQNEVRETAFITHTVRPGDTLASLAQRYYGDRSRSEVIWETNQLPPNPRLAAGVALKIPEIPGVPFVQPDTRRLPPPPTAIPAPAPGGPARVEPPPKEEYHEVNPLLAEAREALERKDWGQALSDVDRFLSGSPGNADGLAVKKQVLYQQGKAQLDGRRYDESYRTLVQLARLQPDYEDTGKLLPQARSRAIDEHYTRGVRLYQEEKLSAAIAEWRVVLDLDAQHANARKNIDQAERLLKALEQRKKK